jgi:hypothetical protein
MSEKEMKTSGKSGIRKGYQWGRPVMVDTFCIYNIFMKEKKIKQVAKEKPEKVTNGDAQSWWEPFVVIIPYDGKKS